MRITPEAPVAEPHSVSEPTLAGGGARPAEPDSQTSAAGAALEGLAHAFGELRVLGHLDLAVRPGELVGLVGPSGCGKSTLLELVAGLREPTGGAISVDGATSPADRLARCAYMPQRDLLLPWLSAIDNAALAPRNRGV